MKAILPVLFLFYSGYAKASDYFCEVEKSIIMYNPETNETVIRQAKTNKFLVTLAEHEDQKQLGFAEENGTLWGNVNISTGSYKTDHGDAFYANAITTDISGNITSFLTVKMPKTASQSSASTMIFDPGVDLHPTLTLYCFSNELN